MTLPFSYSPGNPLPPFGDITDENGIPQINIGDAQGTIGGAMLSALSGRTQEAISDLLRGDLLSSNVWGALWDAFWGFIKIPLRWVINILKKFFPFIDWDLILDFDPIDTVEAMITQLDAVVDLIKEVPFLGDLIEALTGVVGVGMQELGEWFGNVWQFLASIDFLDPDFDLIDAAIKFIDVILAPAGKLATLAFGKLTGSQLPDIDATKIISGVVDLARMPGFFINGFDLNSSRTMLEQIIAKITGVNLPDLPTLPDPLQVLGNVFSGFNFDFNSPNPAGIIPQIVTALTGDAAGGTIDTIKDWAKNVPVVTSLIPAITGDSEATDISALGIWAQNVLTGSTPIPAENLLGTVSQGLLASLPVSHINLSNPNLLSQGSFNAAGTMDGADGWEWDGSTNHYASGGGSAKVTCNGTDRKLFSNQTIPVIEGDRIELSGWIKTSGFSGSSTSINLAVVPFKGSAPQPTVVLSNRGASPEWTELGTSLPWVVPADVTSIKVRLAVTSDAAAGSVWFDDIWCNKAGLMSQELVDKLLYAWNQIWKGGYGIDEAVDVVGKTVEDLFLAVSNPIAVANLVDTALGNFQTLLDTDPGQAIGTLTNGIGGITVDGTITLEGVLSALAAAAIGVVDNVTRGVTDLVNNIGLLFGVSSYGKEKSDLALDKNSLTNKAIYTGYYGVGGSGEIAEVQQVVEAIRTRLDSGYNLQTMTSSGIWRRPWFQPDVYGLVHGDEQVYEIQPMWIIPGGNNQFAKDSSEAAGDFKSYGGASISTAQSKFGTQSLYFDGQPGSYFARQANRWMLTDDFTLEMWFRPTELPPAGKGGGLYMHASDIAYGGWRNLSHTIILLDSGNILYAANKDNVESSSGRTNIFSSATANLNQWNHVAVVRNGLTITMYLNGANVGSSYVGFSTLNSFQSWGVETLGYYADGSVGAWPFKGYIDEVRLTKSSARYTGSTYTVPTAKFVDREVFGIPKEFYAIAFGGGAGGGAGLRAMQTYKSYATGGIGGTPGGYAAIEIEAGELPASIPYTIGAGVIGQTGSIYSTGTNQTSFGSYLATIENRYFVQDLLGYYSSSESAPGRGGDGGQGFIDDNQKAGNGAGGGWSQLAAGGGGGTKGNQIFAAPTNGGNAANAPVAGKSRSGGGGGGGGGGQYGEYWGDESLRFQRGGWPIYPWGWGGYVGGNTRPAAGGLGGNGGFPGGGGGGGGGAFTWDIYGDFGSNINYSIPAGNGGNGANGIIILIWK